MIAALPVKINSFYSVIALRYARSPYYAIIDTKLKNTVIIENPYVHLSSGAGRKIIELLAEKYNVNAIIAFELGLNVQQIAMQRKLQLIIIHEKNKTLQDILQRMKIISQNILDHDKNNK